MSENRPKPYLGNPQETIAVLNRYKFAFQKKFGQNFLIDTHVLERIIDEAGITPDDFVLEIGPGIGTMTQYLACAAREVVAVEIDKVLIPILEGDTLKAFDNVTVINEDILKVDINKLVEENGKMENGYAGRSYRKGFEFMTDDIVDTLAREAVDKTSILFKAVKPKGGEMPVVMGAGGSGILLHEAIGHAFEADFNRKRTSIFCDLFGKKVCNEHINVVDDGTIAFNRGAVNFDDEGVEGQKTYIVKEGILTSYLHDRISAKHYGVAPTGNGRRDTFRNTPIPRMRATYMEAGNMKEADIISKVKNGIFVDTFTNGQVQIGAGDFTFFVKSGYLIEDGKLTQPIKDINIIGNGPKALADITMVADNDKIDNGTWTCGKDGQSCPVTCGMPSALVSKLTVGGEN